MKKSFLQSMAILLACMLLSSTALAETPIKDRISIESKSNTQSTSVKNDKKTFPYDQKRISIKEIESYTYEDFIDENQNILATLDLKANKKAQPIKNSNWYPLPSVS